METQKSLEWNRIKWRNNRHDKARSFFWLMLRTHWKQVNIHTNAERRWIVPASNCSWHARNMRTALFGKGRILDYRYSLWDFPGRQSYGGPPRFLSVSFLILTNCIIITFMNLLNSLFKYFRFNVLFFCWINVLKHSSFDNLKTSLCFWLNIRLVIRQKHLTTCIHMVKLVHSLFQFQGSHPQCKHSSSFSGCNLEWINHCSEWTVQTQRGICSTSACYRWYGCGPCQDSHPQLSAGLELSHGLTTWPTAYMQNLGRQLEKHKCLFTELSCLIYSAYF